MNKVLFNKGSGLVLFLWLLAQVVSFSQGTWKRIDVPTDKFLKSVFFADSSYGWIAGDSGIILHTSDGGKTWNFQNTQTVNEIADVFFLDRNLGWASSFSYTIAPFGTVLLKTTNGGIDWIQEPYPEENIFITCILFLDSLNGWMGGRPHALLKTTNGGIDWAQAEIDTSVLAFFPVLSMQFYNKKYGYACGGMFDIAGVIWRTSNGGDKWYTIDVSDAPADEVHALYIFDSLHVMGSGGDPDFGYGVGMIRTLDGGLNWDYKELGMQGIAYDLDFRTDKEAWAPLGPSGKFIYSKDTGTTWTEILTPENTAVYDVTFPDSLHGWAVGQKGALLKYMPQVIGSVNQNVSLSTGEFILYQNYPNPFNSTTTIKFSVPSEGYFHSSILQIKVYDVLGNEVAILVNKEFPPGEYETVLNAANFPDGIYFYQLKVTLPGHGETVTSLKKMVLMKSWE